MWRNKQQQENQHRFKSVDMAELHICANDLDGDYFEFYTIHECTELRIRYGGRSQKVRQNIPEQVLRSDYVPYFSTHSKVDNLAYLDENASAVKVTQGCEKEVWCFKAMDTKSGRVRLFNFNTEAERDAAILEAIHPRDVACKRSHFVAWEGHKLTPRKNKKYGVSEDVDKWAEQLRTASTEGLSSFKRALSEVQGVSEKTKASRRYTKLSESKPLVIFAPKSEQRGRVVQIKWAHKDIDDGNIQTISSAKKNRVVAMNKLYEDVLQALPDKQVDMLIKAKKHIKKTATVMTKGDFFKLYSKNNLNTTVQVMIDINAGIGEVRDRIQFTVESINAFDQLKAHLETLTEIDEVREFMKQWKDARIVRSPVEAFARRDDCPQCVQEAQHALQKDPSSPVVIDKVKNNGLCAGHDQHVRHGYSGPLKRKPVHFVRHIEPVNHRGEDIEQLLNNEEVKILILSNARDPNRSVTESRQILDALIQFGIFDIPVYDEQRHFNTAATTSVNIKKVRAVEQWITKYKVSIDTWLNKDTSHKIVVAGLHAQRACRQLACPEVPHFCQWRRNDNAAVVAKELGLPIETLKDILAKTFMTPARLAAMTSKRSRAASSSTDPLPQEDDEGDDEGEESEDLITSDFPDSEYDDAVSGNSFYQQPGGYSVKNRT
jgi:hypothetical protein